MTNEYIGILWKMGANNVPFCKKTKLIITILLMVSDWASSNLLASVENKILKRHNMTLTYTYEEQEPPLIHICSAHGSCSSRHFGPVYPDAQTHRKSSFRSTHVPPFLHGFVKQSFKLEMHSTSSVLSGSVLRQPSLQLQDHVRDPV